MGGGPEPPASAVEVVGRFLQALARVEHALQLHFDVARSGYSSPLAAWRQSGAPRRGEIAGVGDYQFHGVGCRVMLSSGEEVDFDWNTEGEVIFDQWRLHSYACSVGAVDLSPEELGGGCGALVSEGRLRRYRDGWYRASLSGT